MDKELQDRVWRLLPKDTLEDMERRYLAIIDTPLDKDRQRIFEQTFGIRNSLSDTEPYTEKPCNLSQLTINYDNPTENAVSGTKVCTKSDFSVQNQQDMEEKDLNLCELLKGCEGMELYSPAYGKCTLTRIYEDNNNGSQPLINVTLEDGTNRNFTSDGKITWGIPKSAPISLFPLSLYEKYPLDGFSAWMEWKEEHKQKRWRAEKGCSYYYLDHKLFVVKAYEPFLSNLTAEINYRNGNYFRTESDAQEASEVVRKALEDFHKRKEEEK